MHIFEKMEPFIGKMDTSRNNNYKRQLKSLW